MKNMIIMVSIILLMLWPTTANASEGVQVRIDGKLIDFDMDPIIQDMRTMVPLRGVFEALGAKVEWNQATHQVVIMSNSHEILLEVDQASLLNNGVLQNIDTKTFLKDDRVLIPLRFVAEGLGHQVTWDPKTKTAIITTQEQVVEPSTTLPIIDSMANLKALLRYNHLLNGYIENFGLSPLLPIETDNETITQEASAQSEKSSETNTQTQGVDEGDLTKTNGSLIATISSGQIVLIDPTPTNPTIYATLDFKDLQVSELYLNDTYLTILATQTLYTLYPYEESTKRSLYPRSHQASTFIKVYDISSPSTPLLVKDLRFDGTLLTSRMIGKDLYFVTKKDFYYSPLNDLTEQDLTLSYTDSLSETKTNYSLDTLKYFPAYVTPNLMMTVGLSLDRDTIDVDTYLGSADVVYMSQDRLYLSVTHYGYANRSADETFMPIYEQDTLINAFTVQNGHIDYQASGKVPGKVLNQFSFDEYEGNLRVATTTGDLWSDLNPSLNHLYVLDTSLNILGHLGNLAPGERVYSSRFIGDRVYLVTYKQVDPFYVIETSDPKTPKVLGYLKTPGFSSYLHLLDENHILGFGTETYEEEGRILTGGFKLSLFDVTNPAKPIEEKKEVIGVGGTYSSVSDDHKALLYNPDLTYMAFPITISAKTPYTTDYVGAYLYDLRLGTFTYKGNISHHTVDTLSGGYKYYDQLYAIKRLLTIGDKLYALSDGKLTVSSLDGKIIYGTLSLSDN